MKIKSDMTKSYLRNYNEAKGIAVNKKIVLKKQTNKVPTYLTSALITIIILSIFLIIFKIIDKSQIITIIFLIMLIIYILYVLLRTIWSYNLKKKSNFINEILINEAGITDSSFYNIKININWNKIKALVIKKYTLTFITDTSLYFFFDIKEKAEIIKITKKYNKNILIIE